jgi:hypothetical protein
VLVNEAGTIDIDSHLLNTAQVLTAAKQSPERIPQQQQQQKQQQQQQQQPKQRS